MRSASRRLGATVRRAIELAPELLEATGEEVAAPPATLFTKDSKQGYNVTTPSSAFAYWNTMQHLRSGTEILDTTLALAARAIAEAEEEDRAPDRAAQGGGFQEARYDG
ncbi:MAG: hypothetical protein HC794_05470 [Nitrospiraceae bacterium]|nr:hypothetical protein [Nitrospiraceae bacterium]